MNRCTCDVLMLPRENYYTLNLNKRFVARGLKFFKVAPIKLQTQNIIKIKMMKDGRLNDQHFATVKSKVTSLDHFVIASYGKLT
jgi:hypothetical protein